MARFLLDRLARAWRADRAAVCHGAATDRALWAHALDGLPVRHRWNSARWGGLGHAPRLQSCRVRGRQGDSGRFVTDSRRCWSGRTLTTVLDALLRFGIHFYPGRPVRKGDMAACAIRPDLLDRSTGPP